MPSTCRPDARLEALGPPASCPPPEDAVDPSGGHAAAGEEELEDGDVPADHPAPHEPRAEERAPETAELRPRPRPGHAVHEEAVALLEDADRAPRHRAGDPVDRAGVEAPRLERDLESWCLSTGVCWHRRRRAERSEERCERDAPGGSHGGVLGGPPAFSSPKFSFPAGPEPRPPPGQARGSRMGSVRPSGRPCSTPGWGNGRGKRALPPWPREARSPGWDARRLARPVRHTICGRIARHCRRE